MESDFDLNSHDLEGGCMHSLAEALIPSLAILPNVEYWLGLSKLKQLQSMNLIGSQHNQSNVCKAENTTYKRYFIHDLKKLFSICFSKTSFLYSLLSNEF